MNLVDLNGTWSLYQSGDDRGISVNVPGDVNDALLRAGRIPDPRYDTQARQCYWITSKKWVYRKRIHVDPPFETARICLENVDGTSALYVNGKEIGGMKNAFRRHRFDLSGILRPGENDIEVRFAAVDELLGPRLDELAGWKGKRAYLRKPQYNFGWDWALPLPSLGLAGNVRIELDYTREIIDYSVKADPSGRMEFAFEVSGDAFRDGYEIFLAVDGQGERHEVKIDKKAFRTYTVIQFDDPKLWWPRGYGEQPLYDYTVRLACAGHVCQQIRGRVGFRKIELLEEPFTGDAGDGYSFWLLCNGERIFCKGGNWIPMELWPGAVKAPDYEYYLQMTANAHFNMQRVWGGGIYEYDRFYDLCDELGILVWQDFMFASAGYPVDLLRDEIMREADFQIRRLRSRTCVGLWCGCNEDIYSWSYRTNVMDARALYAGGLQKYGNRQQDTGVYAELDPEEAIDRDYLDPQLYTMILRGMVGRWGLGAPFVESSPMSRDDAGNLPASGNSHISAWKYSLFQTGGQYERWRDHFDEVCSFDSEFCDQGPCSVRLIRSFLKPENHWPPNDAWVYHIQRGHGNIPHHIQTLRIAGATFGEITSLQQYVKHGQATHAEMMRTEFDSARFDYPHNGGTMMWMFNDCWPTSNWSIIDYSKNPKPCYYAAKRACAPVSPILFARKGILYAAVSNHSLSPKRVTAQWGEARFDGAVISSQSAEAMVIKHETIRLGKQALAERVKDADFFYLKATVDGEPLPTVVYFPDGWRDLRFPEPKYHVSFGELQAFGNQYCMDISVTADSFIRMFHLNDLGKGLSTMLSDNYFDMLKGETRQLRAIFADRPRGKTFDSGDWFSDWE